MINQKSCYFKIILAYCLVFTSLEFLFAQEEQYKQNNHWVESYGKRSGLPEDVIFGLLPSKSGFLWMATPYYLVRYNGYEFTYWAPNTERYFHFIDMMEDKKGNIWVSTGQGGLFHFDIRKEEFTHFHAEAPSELSISDNIVYSRSSSTLPWKVRCIGATLDDMK